MSDGHFRDPTASTGSLRLTALALLLAGGATAGLALHPGLALADGPAATSGPAAHRSAAVHVAVAPFADDEQAADPDAVDDDGVVEDDAVPDDDAALADDDGGAADDTADPADIDLADDPADDPITAVAIDRRGRALEGPRTFVADRTARASKLRWTHWNDATAVAKGRIVVRGTGRAHRGPRGTGTLKLSRLTVCGDGTPVYRRAVFAVAGKRAVTVKLPGCSALR